MVRIAIRHRYFHHSWATHQKSVCDPQFGLYCITVSWLSCNNMFSISECHLSSWRYPKPATICLDGSQCIKMPNTTFCRRLFMLLSFSCWLHNQLIWSVRGNAYLEDISFVAEFKDPETMPGFVWTIHKEHRVPRQDLPSVLYCLLAFLFDPKQFYRTYFYI